jgi:hypothetical protein
MREYSYKPSLLKESFRFEANFKKRVCADYTNPIPRETTTQQLRAQLYTKRLQQ